MKNHSSFLFGLGVFITLVLFSCSQDEWLSMEENADGQQTSASTNSLSGS